MDANEFYTIIQNVYPFVGFAIFIAIWVQVQDIKPAIWGLLPLALGLAFLLIYKLHKKDKVKELP